jgi:hypothetical protein
MSRSLATGTTAPLALGTVVRPNRNKLQRSHP